MGIAIDLLVVLFLVWSVVRGWRLGLLYQIAYLALMVVAYFASRLLAGALDKPVAKLIGAAPIVGGTLTFFVSLMLLLIIGAVVVRRMTRDLVPEDSVLSPPNRALGAIVAGAKGALIAFVLLVFLLQLQTITNKIQLPVSSSVSLRFVRENNFLDDTGLGSLTKLVWLASTKKTSDLAQDPRMQRIMSHEKAKALMTPELAVALNEQDYVALFNNDALWSFLEDPEIRAELEAIPW